jgi:hypothetical protein
MAGPAYQVVYDVLAEGALAAWLQAALLAAAAGALVALAVRGLKGLARDLTLLALLTSLASAEAGVLLRLRATRKCQALVHSGDAPVVEGRVHLLPREEDDERERLEVGGVALEVWPQAPARCGLREPGLWREGDRARVAHRGAWILRAEVARP